MSVEDVRGLIGSIRELAEQQGFMEETLLETVAGPVMALTRGKGPAIYLSSGIHGDEPSGPQALKELFEEEFFSSDYRWLICPLMNPTGLAAGTRETGAGLDMNRDYRLCKTAEAARHVAWLRSQPSPDLFLSLHEDWESSGVYLYEINVPGEESFARALLEAGTRHLPIEPEAVIDDHEVHEPGWIYHSSEPDMETGWPEAIFLAKEGCPLSYTMETPSSLNLRKRVDCHKAMVRRAIELFSETKFAKKG